MSKLLESKRTYIASDGEEYLDLSIPSLNIKNLKGNLLMKVASDEKGRIDKITWKYARKDLDVMNQVLYYNHIFNPFAINEGDILYIPNTNTDYYITANEPKLIDGSKHSTDEHQKSEKTYAENVEFLALTGFGAK